MSELTELSDTLQFALAEFLPGLPLRWYHVPSGCYVPSGYELPGELQGFFLEQEPALLPLPGDLVPRVMDAPPFWSLLWPSGETACRLLLDSAELVRGKSVLDFGCGCGLLACAAARVGAIQVFAVDNDPLAARAARLHALANRTQVEVVTDWDGREVDLLIVADFLYDTTHLPLFEALASAAREVLVVDSRLRVLPMKGFLYLGERSGKAIPDLEKGSPTREFGSLRFWYRGARNKAWDESFQRLSDPVACRLAQC